MLKCMQMVLLLLFLVIYSFAGTTGKLSGVVVDKETGAPLPGVNVILEGTMLGGSTDLDGFYNILHIPAKTYTVKFLYIGYQDLKIQNIRIVPDITKRLNTELNEATLELDDQIIVVAEKPFFEVSATNSIKVLDSEDIDKIPVRGVNQVVALNAGVVAADGSGGETGNAEINVRGGRDNETLVVIDGIPYDDIWGGGTQGTIPDNAIEQISSQLGGFGAKYGSAQSGVINIITKSGARNFFGSVEGITSEATDAFGYNMVNAGIGGPLFPGSQTYSFFGSAEYIKTDTERPRATGIVIPTAGIDKDGLLNAGSEVLRFSGKVDANFDKFKLSFSGNGSLRDYNMYTHSYAKTNSEHNQHRIEDVYSASLRFSHFIDETTFWDLTARARTTGREEGDGVWFENLNAYGDTLANKNYYSSRVDASDPMFTDPYYWNQGSRVTQDEVGVFFDRGRVSNRYRKANTLTYGLDMNFSKQFKNNFVELGASIEQSSMQYYSIRPVSLAIGLRGENAKSSFERYSSAQPFYFGYDVEGNSNDKTTWSTDASGNLFRNDGLKKPVSASLYLQDKFEFDDFILNLGIRWDYFDPNSMRIKDITNPFRFGANPSRLDPEDWEDIPTESNFSPRIGFAFPITEKSVFHAQYGIFRQEPRLLDLYNNWFDFEGLETDDNYQADHGHLKSEITTQYEFGFKYQFEDYASIDITAFYKNVEGLTNVMTQFANRGQETIRYITAANTDFGTIKGLTFSANLRRLGPVSARLDYTLANAEGTGSSQNSSYTAAFRNTNGETPKSIAPVEFDQRHTLTASVDVRAFKGEGPSIGGFKIFENTGANFLFSFNSGRPYTPLERFSVLPGASSNQGELTQYINSARGGSVIRLDLKLERTINITNSLSLQPYLIVQNLLDRDNSNEVYATTGQADDTGFLDTAVGQAFVKSSSDPEAFESDYKALEKDPLSYGLPRIIRLGMKLKF